MFRRIVSGIMLTLLLISLFTLAFNIQLVEADGTIYIRADGSIDPADAPILREGDLYTLTANIMSESDGIIVERNNMTLDGAGYTLQGTGAYQSKGVDLSGTTNVTVQNVQIRNFYDDIWLDSSSGNSISGNKITESSRYGIVLNSSSGNSISGNNITNNGAGIKLSSFSNNSISGNNITNNGEYGIELSSSSNNSISGNNITNNYYGIKILSSSNYNTISGNNIANSEYGICLYSSSNYNSISGNNIADNGEYGIELAHSSNYNSVSGNNITANNYYGIELAHSSNYNSVSGNNIAKNGYGMFLGDHYSSNYNSISGNTFTNDGLAVGGSCQNFVENNTVNGKPLVYLEGVANYSVSDAGQVILINCDSIKVENLNLSRTTIGVQLWKTTNSIISGNNITANRWHCIMLSFSSNNSISGNNITNNGEYGIYGVSLDYSSNNSISGNNITNNWWGIMLASSSNNNISGNNITANNGAGIVLAVSSNNSISGDNIANNGYGIFFGDASNYNSISRNNITNNGEYGIWLSYNVNNKIYHNNFINNVQQAFCSISNNTWDDSYPSGGNYWSDYTDVDLYSGPYQNETGSDGIWDHPHVIDEDNQDRYPFANPWVPTTPRIISIDPSQPISCSGRQWLTILGEGFVLSSDVTLSYGSDIYHIPRDRTWFIGPNKIEVLVGLTVKGLWEVWVTNPPSGIQSNDYAFQVRSFTTEDCEKVAALALQYWDAKNATIMAAIAAAESNLNPNVGGDYGISDFNCSGYASWGLWQIYMKMHLDKLEELGAPIDDPYKTAKWLSDPNNNVRAAYKVWEEAYRIWGDGFLPWSTYKNGEYKKYLKMFERRISIFKSPVNVTITDEYDRIISEIENQIPGASFEYFEMTASKVFYLPSNLTYIVQLNAIAYGNCTISQITPLESIYETAFSQATFNLTSETVAEFDLLPYDANYTLEVDENGDGTVDYELIPDVGTSTTEYDIGITEIAPSKTIIGEGYSLPINITVLNYGAYTETFNITLYANDTFIELQTITLTNGTPTTITFTWNTSGFATGTYTISAYAEPVLGETEIADNRYTDGIVNIAPFYIDGPYYTWYGTEYWIVEIGKHPTRLVSNY